MDRIDVMTTPMERRSTGNRRMIIPLARSLIVAGALAMACTAAPAQSSASKAGINEDLRPAFATPEEIAEGKRLAETSCIGCHGDAGISSTPKVPHIAGQRPGYLYIELKAYRAGARGDNPMANAVKFLNDDALVKVAAYFANLDPAQPNPNEKAAATSDPVAAGKAAAASCDGCHGERGVSKTAGTPSISGFDPKYFVVAMKAYRSGQRKHATMKAMVDALGDADLNNLALYYAL